MHGDVFRPPRYLELLAALVGTGVQLALLVLSVILITIAGQQQSQTISEVKGLWPLHGFVASCHDGLYFIEATWRSLLGSCSPSIAFCLPGAYEIHGSRQEPGAGTLFTERGTIVTVFIICYALTSFVAGYVRCEEILPLPSVGPCKQDYIPFSCK